MKIVLLNVCALLAFAASASAEIIGVEQFDYPDGAIAGRTGGTFWDYKNVASAGHTGSPSAWENFTGAPTVTSGQLVTSNTSAKRKYNPTEGNGQFDGTTVNKVVYYRVVFTTGATLPDFAGLSSYFLTTEQIFFGKPFGQANFGFSKLGANTLSTTAVQANTTYTLVTKLDYVTNTIRLYINPDLTAAEPASADASATFGSSFNPSTAIRLASGSASAVTWDDLVVATTWDDFKTVVTTTADEDNGSFLPTAGGGAGVSLREAVKYSPTGVIIFAPALNGQSCILSLGDMSIDKTVTIDASGLANGVTVDANGTSRHFFINGASARLTLKSLTLTNGNSALQNGGTFGGGAILLFQGNLLLQRCTLSNNTCTEGGAVLQQGPTGSRFEHCTFAGNFGHDVAGALELLSGTCALSRCTVAGNSSAGTGGGLFVQSPGSVSVEGCIIAGNVSPSSNDIGRISGTVTAIGASLIGSNASVESTFTGPLAGTQGAPLDPKLSALGYFGGPTQTMHPLVSSPAIDAGGTTDPGGTDQRGFPRFVDGDGSGTAQLDIGAVEAWPHARSLFIPDHPVTTATDEDDGSILAGLGTGTSLREAVKYAASGSVITFSSSMAGQTITLSGSEIPLDKNLFIDASNLSSPVTISGNNASRVFNIAAGATVAMQRLTIVNGKSPDGADGGSGIGGDGADGGGIQNNGTLSLVSCTVSNCRTGRGGNGGFGAGRGGLGGGISSSGTLNLLSSSVAANFTGNGGDAFNYGVGGDGGGICSSGALSIMTCSIVANHTGNSGNGGAGQGGNGGGISSSGTFGLTSSSVTGNQTGSRAFGGGIFTTSASIHSSTIAGNQAAQIGGGIDVANQLALEHCTVAGNQASFGGGVGTNSSITALMLARSIIAGNTATGGLGPDLRTITPGGSTTVGANFIGNLSNAGAFSGPAPLTGDARLAPLGDYGGPTQTMALKPGSPARDAATGSTATNDQRGFPIVGTPDLGAYEAGTITNFANFIYESLPATATDSQHASTFDFDGDGVSNGSEYLALTNPGDPTSYLRFSQTSRSGSNLSYTFATVGGLHYSLEYTSDLVTWTHFADYTGSGLPVNDAVGPVTGFTKFFLRVRVQP